MGFICCEGCDYLLFDFEEGGVGESCGRGRGFDGWMGLFYGVRD